MDLGLPNGIDLTENLDGLEIVRRWFSIQTVFLTFFVVFWDGFLVFWYTQAINTSNIMMLVFPLLHVAIGVGLTYYVLASYVNRTYIRVNHSFLSIQHAPLPFPGNRTVDASDIKQVYSKENISRSRRSNSVTYEVHALTRNGRNLKLLSRLPNSEQALFIEQEIERFLRIQDVPVRGEIAR
ncbi:MAG: hypothetical protein GY832_36225 [Chloroflexi bacterium]|nr:hypothetical protein [Chloroflexota bacterium]